MFAWIGAILVKHGFLNKTSNSNQAFVHFCGRYLGEFLKWFIPILLFAVVVVMVSGAGATVNQYFGEPQWVGSLLWL
ncbi:hypothetical protein [Bavariicoccus seileri]|uniref:hypothetical protein n=1 Tax=Bavariicoccus seileri TaxID=549685 RepID=UPI003F932FC5